jgi:hypothetical protein
LLALTRKHKKAVFQQKIPLKGIFHHLGGKGQQILFPLIDAWLNA